MKVLVEADYISETGENNHSIIVVSVDLTPEVNWGEIDDYLAKFGIVYNHLANKGGVTQVNDWTIIKVFDHDDDKWLVKYGEKDIERIIFESELKSIIDKVIDKKNRVQFAADFIAVYSEIKDDIRSKSIYDRIGLVFKVMGIGYKSAAQAYKNMNKLFKSNKSSRASLKDAKDS